MTTKSGQSTSSLWDLEAERELWADICRKDFWHFCDYALGYGDHPDFNWWVSRVHKPFCEWLQHHILEWHNARLNRGEGQEGTPKFLMVVVHREFGKSMIGTKALTIWLHVLNPNLSSYLGSSTVTRAQFFFDPIKSVLDGSDPYSKFTWLYGNWYDKTRTWAASQIIHGARIAVARSEPSIGTWGVETGLTGTHPDHGNIDDPIDYELMGKDGQWLEKVNSHLASLSPVFRDDALFIYTGTRYHDSDAIGTSLRLEGVRSVSGMPVPGFQAAPDGKWDVYFMAARDKEGKPTFPENWPERRLREYERRHSIQYAAQLMNDPNTGAHVALTRRQLEEMVIDKKDLPANLRYSIHLDTAFKSREAVARGDESVIQLWGHTRDGSGDVYFVEGLGSNVWRVEDFNTQLIMLLQRLRAQRKWPFVLTDEVTVGGKEGTWELIIQSWCHQAGIPSPNLQMLNRAGKKKINRILGAVSYWVDGHVRLVRGANGLDKLMDQMARIGTSSHDDWADAAADVFNPAVYAGIHRGPQKDVQPMIRRPWDRELQTGGISDEEAIQYYDGLESVGRETI